MDYPWMENMWIKGNLGEGFATYVRKDGEWYSVNGVEPEIAEIRWRVTRKELIKYLNKLAFDESGHRSAVKNSQ
jgi:hypothetical protein